jgi:hypothetical protein
METFICDNCGSSVTRTRPQQRYCSRKCKNTASARRRRGVETQKRVTRHPATPERVTRLQPPVEQAFTTNFTEVLKGDDYPLEYCPDGYPKLPARLERRPGISVAVKLRALRGTDAGPNQLREGAGCGDNDCLTSAVPFSEAA